MKRALWLLAFALVACNLPEGWDDWGDAPAAGDAGQTGGDSASGDTASGDTATGDAFSGDSATGGDDWTECHAWSPPGDAAVSTCPRLPQPDDYVRKVIVSHPYPYDASVELGTTWEVWELDAAGDLTTTGETFAMGRSTGGTVAFTADGEIGFAVSSPNDGTLGVFRLGATVEVIHAAYSGELYPFYAEDVVVTPDSRRALVIDHGWCNADGGIYSLRIECDGTLVEEGLLAGSKLAETLQFVPSREDRCIIPAREALDSGADHDLHLLAWDAGLARLDSVPGFADPETMIAGVALTPDGRYALMGDNNIYYTYSNRVAVVELTGDSLAAIDVLVDINDPVDIVTSPYNNAALVLDGTENSLHTLDYDSTDSVQPFTCVGEPTYSGQSPQLPNSAVVISRGSLTGLVLIAENVGVRRVRFESDGSVTDLGLTSYGEPIERIVGALGVQP